MMTRRSARPASFAADASRERGAALLTAVFALLLLTLLGLSLTHLSLTALNVSNNDRESTEAFYIAEAGIEHAIALINAAGPGSYASIATRGNLSETPSATHADRIPVAGCNIGGGTYTVTVANGGVAGRLRVTSTGTGRNNSNAVIEAVVGAETSVALVANGNVKLGGSLEIKGAGGVLHANGNLANSGSVRAQQHFSASGTLTNSGLMYTGTPPNYNDNPKDLRQNQPSMPAPTITPATIALQADYILRSNGQLVVKDTGVIYTPTNTLKWNGWGWSSSSGWSHDMSGTLNGTYYAQGGSIKWSGSVGSSGAPAQITLIADGSIQLGGTSHLTPDIPGYLVIAGTDLKLPGTTTTYGGGTLYAGHQFDSGGTTNINGQVVVANLLDSTYPKSNTDSENLVPITSGISASIDGVFNVTNSGSSGGGFRTYSWRERRE